MTGYENNFSTVSASIHLTSSPSPAVAGDTVSLACSVTLPGRVTGTPDFQWKGPGGVTITPADSTTNGGTVSSDLTLSEISTSQAGQYTCTATLSGSNTTSTTITVQSEYMYILYTNIPLILAWFSYIPFYMYVYVVCSCIVTLISSPSAHSIHLCQCYCSNCWSSTHSDM